MKKSIIAAGAASVALAAMPIVSTFAATAPTITDNITLTLQNTCNITRTAVGDNSAGVAGSTWTPGADAAVDPGTYAVTMNAGTTAHLGKSTIKVTCNDNNKGHSLAAAFTGLTANTTDNPYLSAAVTIGYDDSAAVSATSSSWNVTATANDTLGVQAGIIPSSGTVYSNTKALVNESVIELDYNVGVQPDQAAATYKGSAVYTLTYGV